MSKACYFDKTGAPMSKETWEEKRADEEYSIIRQFDDGAIRVIIRWNGYEPLAADKFNDMWDIFVAEVHNYGRDNKMVPDPVENGVTFPNEKEAIEWYEEFLGEWTGSSVEEVRNAKGTWTQKFVEVGNTLAPPTAEELSTPETVPDDDIGAW